MSSMSSIKLYAEVLLNIRSVSFVATAKSTEHHETIAEVQADGETLSLKHLQDAVYLSLHCALPDGNGTRFQVPPGGQKTLSLRARANENLLKEFKDDRDGADGAPWRASTLTSQCVLSCGECNAPLVPSNTMSSWKDLPSEHWAEMMDFWHCHKPDVPEHSGQASDAPAHKGYAASNTLLASSGLGYVGKTSFLFAADDVSNVVNAADQEGGTSDLHGRSVEFVSDTVCQYQSYISALPIGTRSNHFYSLIGESDFGYSQLNLRRVQSEGTLDAILYNTSYEETRNSDGNELIVCTTCRALVGWHDRNARGVRVHKSALRLQPTLASKAVHFSIQKWLSTHLLDLVEAQATRKFLVRSSHSEAMCIWIFTPDFLLCSVSSEAQVQYSQPTRAMKVLYRRISPVESEKMEADQSPTAEIEILDLPVWLQGSLMNALVENEVCVPASSREWSGWVVSFLLRFSVADLSE